MAAINVISPDGQSGTIPEEQAKEAFANGFRAETPEEAKVREDKIKYGEGIGNELKAGAEGLARGTTLGLSDVLLTKTGLVEPEALRGRREHNPIASTTGEVVGTVAPLLIPGGQFTAAGAASKAGLGAAGLAAKAGAEKVLSRVAAGAVEGGLYGVGSGITEDVLEDGKLDLAAEKMLAHVGIGAALGGGLEGLTAGVQKGIGKIFGSKAEKVVEEVAGKIDPEAPALGSVAKEPKVGLGLDDIPNDEVLSKVASENAGLIKDVMSGLYREFPTPENLALRHLDVTGAQMAKLNEKGVARRAAKALLDDQRFANARTLHEGLDLIRTRLEEAGEKIGASVSKFDELAEAGERFNPLNVANRIDEEILEPLKKGTSLNDPIVKKLRTESRRLRKLAQESGNAISFKDAEDYKRGLDPFLRWDSAEPGALKDALRQVRGIVNSEIESGVEEIAIRRGDLGLLDEWKSAKRSYGDMAQLEAAVSKRASAKEGNRYFSLTDYITGASQLGGLAGMLDGDVDPKDMAMGGIGFIGNKWARERLAHVLAVQLHKGLKSPAQGIVAKTFQRAFKALEEATPQAPMAAGMASPATLPGPSVFMEKYGQALKSAAIKGPQALYATHAALSEVDPEYRSLSEEAGLTKTSSREEDEVDLVRASKLSAIQASAEKQDRKFDRHIASILNGQAEQTEARPSVKSGEKRLEELSKLVADPKFIEQMELGVDLPAVAPGVSKAVAASTSRAVQFLHSKVPKPSSTAIRPMKWVPSKAELAKFDRYVRAVDEPGSILAEAAKGTLTKEAVEAVQVVYPNLYAQMSSRLLEKLAEHGNKPLPYRSRLGMSILLGTSIDGSAKPASIRLNQAAHQASKEEKKATAARADKLTLSSRSDPSNTGSEDGT